MLVIDDMVDDLSFVRDLLCDAGYRVTGVSSLGEARRALSGGSFRLVLTDLYLNDASLGYEIAVTARSMNPPIPVVLLTAYASFGHAQEAVRTQVHAILSKPVDARALLTACRRAIAETEIRRRNQQLAAENRVLAQVLPRAIEVKDPLTRGHSERVVRYADVLARMCRVSTEDRESLRMAALLHDVGKIGISQEILAKPGALTTDEREVIQRHPEMGYEILAPLENEDVRLWVYQHHERWDGKGYPNQLRGEEVALPGRILILAEVYDALAERRSYKEPWDNQQIVDFFRAQAGTHFDPDVANIVADGLARRGPKFFAAEPGLLF